MIGAQRAWLIAAGLYLLCLGCGPRNVLRVFNAGTQEWMVPARSKKEMKEFLSVYLEACSTSTKPGIVSMNAMASENYYNLKLIFSRDPFSGVDVNFQRKTKVLIRINDLGKYKFYDDSE